MEPMHVLAAQDEVGETPIWVPEEQALYWVDIGGGRIRRYDPATGATQTWQPGVPVTALARRGPGRWLLASKTGIYFWTRGEDRTEFVADPEASRPGLRCNDGAVDRQGRFLAGTMNEGDLNAADGSLYRLDPDRTIHRLDTGYAVANGLGWSPDGGTVYVTDMFHRRILAYSYDTASGTVSGRRTFASVPEDAGLPDGLVVDAEGGVWSAHWGGWRVTRYTPDGAIERVVRLPVANVTCMGFGGADLNELYITTAWFLLSDAERASQPMAGDLFRLSVGIQGIPEPCFAG
jgi:sugar lactone lactonase YvrE